MPIQVKKEIDFFTIDEQRAFISVAKDYANYPQFRLILETGMRTSELIGLQWKNVDFEKKEIHTRRTLEYRYSLKKWTWGPPKTNHGIRTIKMTEKAYEILMAVKNGHSNINDRTPEEFKDIVFLNRTGFPTKNSTYDAAFAEDV